MNLDIHIIHVDDFSLQFLLNSFNFSIEEKEEFNKCTHERTKKEKIISILFKKKYIGKYYLNKFNKPISDDVYFNISHSHGYVAFIKDNVPIGIDIELVRKIKPDLISYTANEEEKKYIHDNSSFFEIWTNKEALVKAYGSGIKGKINLIPALPFNAKKNYHNRTYFNKTICYKGLIITVSREGNQAFNLNIVKEIFNINNLIINN